MQVEFQASASDAAYYNVSVMAAGQPVLGSPGVVQIVAHITQPADWQIFSTAFSNGTLAGLQPLFA